MVLEDEQRLMIDGPAGRLEARYTPRSGARVLAVICHPNPLHGGSLQNKVVHTLLRAAVSYGAASLRFNFRGVGNSQGEHASGFGEVDDCLAAIDWLRGEAGDLPLWLMGFSFGGYVAAAAASRLPEWPERLLLAAPSVVAQPFDALLPLGGPVSVLVPAQDEVVPASAQRAMFADSMQAQLVEFADCGHFFHRRLGELRDCAESLLAD